MPKSSNNKNKHSRSDSRSNEDYFPDINVLTVVPPFGPTGPAGPTGPIGPTGEGGPGPSVIQLSTSGIDDIGLTPGSLAGVGMYGFGGVIGSGPIIIPPSIYESITPFVPGTIIPYPNPLTGTAISLSINYYFPANYTGQGNIVASLYAGLPGTNTFNLLSDISGPISIDTTIPANVTAGTNISASRDISNLTIPQGYLLILSLFSNNTSVEPTVSVITNIQVNPDRSFLGPTGPSNLTCAIENTGFKGPAELKEKDCCPDVTIIRPEDLLDRPVLQDRKDLLVQPELLYFMVH